jgi:hypothetical protein
MKNGVFIPGFISLSSNTQGKNIPPASEQYFKPHWSLTFLYLEAPRLYDYVF